MKITKEKFWDELTKQAKAEKMDNYKMNMQFNAGRWNYWNITRCTIDTVTYYSATCCPYAYSNIATLKRLCRK